MATIWTCCQCTYRHESRESGFLTCAICATPRSTGGKAKTTIARQPDAITTTTGRKKRQGNLLDHFGTNQRQQQQEEQSIPTTTTTATKRQRTNTTTTATTATTSRSLLDALKPSRASSFAPRARYRDHPKDDWREIPNDSDISKLCPMTVIRDVLPVPVASALLTQLEEESKTWNRGNWIVHGKEHPIPRTTAMYPLTIDHHDSPAQQQVDDDDEEYQDQQRIPSPELQQAADTIARLVQQHCPYTATEPWKPTFAFANRYANGQDCVGWHADHITPLGPRPIIVGLSLGACRPFEMRQTTPKARHVSVPLPHNSICIMWNDAQESWQHSVPRCSSSLHQHPIVGPVRISLTFRQKRRLATTPMPPCHCGRPAGLKAHRDGRYYLFCRPYGNDKHKTCGFWKPCLWAEQEAKRMIQWEKATYRSKQATTTARTTTTTPNQGSEERGDGQDGGRP